MDSSAQVVAQVDKLYIEVELREKDLPKFSKRTVENGGRSVNKGTEGVLVRSGLQGPNVRIYFNADDSLVAQLAMFGYVAIEGAADSARGHWRSEYRWRLDSNEFYWKLVRNGFRLGTWPAPVCVAAS